MAKNRDDNLNFKGFRSPNYTQVPDELFDYLLPALSGAELKVLLYIIRRTFGFKRDSDTISLSQLLHGIQARDGRILDRGTGLSKPALLQSLRSLEDKNIIETERRRSAEKGDEPTVYTVKFADDGGGKQSLPPVVKKLYQGGGQESLPGPWSKKLTTQETVLQETDRQQSNNRYASQSQENVDNSQDRSTSEAAEDSSLRPVPPGIREERDTGFTMVGDVVAQKMFRPPQEVSEARQVILEYISDFALEMGDEAKLSASVTRAVNLYRRSGRDLGEFTSALYEARSRTKEYTGNVTKRKASPDGQYAGKNKMPYFFSVLEELLRLKEDNADSGSVPAPRPEKPGMGGRRPRKPRADHDTSPP